MTRSNVESAESSFETPAPFDDVPDHPMLDVAEIASYLSIAPSTVKARLLRTGVLPWVRVGSKTIRVPRAAFVEYLRSQLSYGDPE